MVQLKSFRYIETEDESGNRIRQYKNDPKVDLHTTSESIAEESASSTSSTRWLPPESGPNLTSSSDTNSTDKSANLGEESVTLSSQDEYQSARLDMSEDDESTGATSRKGSLGATLNADLNHQFVSPQLQRVYKSATGNSTSSTLSPRIKNKFQQQLQSRQMSPMLSIRGNPSDSPASFGIPNNINENQFEIRWHKINLMAKKSKVPACLGESSICNFLRGKISSLRGKSEQDESPSEKMYYSPPIKHKVFVPSTVNIQESSENDDMQEMKNDQNYRPVLVDVSGSVFSGQMTAVLGPSGVGKTSLLDSLTGRNTLEGTGRVNLIGSANKRMSVVTVPQADVLPNKLTTIEDLQFTSRLKNPRADFDHKRNIDRIVKHLHMDKFLHNRIEKLSGGEARRLSIARELLSSPDILILDEPTSGLDANTCKKIITALRDIVEHSENILDRPMAIIVTIHQPQQEVFNLFHRVYVMAIGGRAIYEGPPTSLLPTLLYQSSLSQVCDPSRLNENPAIVAIEVASGEYGPNIITELASNHANQFYEESIHADDRFQNSPLSTPRMALSVSPRIQQLARANRLNADGSLGRPTPLMARRLQSSQFDKISNVTSLSYASTYDADLPEVTTKLKVDKRLRRSVVMKSSFVYHTWILMRRCWLLTTRDLFLMMIRILGFFLVAMGVVQIFSHALDPNEHQCPEYQTEVDDVMSFMENTKERLLSVSSMLRQANSQHTFFFHLVLCIIMVTSALTGLVFPLQMRMFVREFKNGWYSAASFIMSQTLAELPVDMIGPTLSVLIAYPLCHQPDSEYNWREIAYIVVLFIAASICKSQAQIIGAIFMDSIENSVFLSCVAVTLPALLSGIAVRVSQMSIPLQWMSYGSCLRYTFESLFELRYGYGICPCDPESIKGFPAKIAAEAVPSQLDNLARGIIDLASTNVTTTLLDFSGNNSTEIADNSYFVNVDTENIFTRFLRLVTGASNLFVQNPSDLGTCEKYRSLYLISMDIPNNITPYWVGVLLAMWIGSRFLTYIVIRAVIKLRRR